MGKQLKKVRAENNDPINFTCGICRQVHKYEGSLDCPDAPPLPQEDGAE